MADYRNSSGIVVEDGPLGPTLAIEDSSRVDPWIVRQADAKPRRVPSGWPSSAAATDRRRAADTRATRLHVETSNRQEGTIMSNTDTPPRTPWSTATGRSPT